MTIDLYVLYSGFFLWGQKYFLIFCLAQLYLNCEIYHFLYNNEKIPKNIFCNSLRVFLLNIQTKQRVEDMFD